MTNKESLELAVPGIMECIICGNMFGISDDDEVNCIGIRSAIPGICKNKTCKDSYNKFLKEIGYENKN